MELVLGIVGLANLSISLFLVVCYRRQTSKIDAIESIITAQPVCNREATENPPVEDLPGVISSDVDIVGAWALEQRSLGNEVSDAEINMQRQMRLEAGL